MNPSPSFLEIDMYVIIAMAFIIVIVPAILSCLQSWKIAIAGVILAGITLAELSTRIPPLK
jgi:hypothetical protein